MAVISAVGIGMRDMHRPGLWFTVHTDDSSAALQTLSWPEAGELIKNNNVTNVSDLHGRACFVDISSPGIIRFVRLAKITGFKKGRE